MDTGAGKIIVSGSSGLIGAALGARLQAAHAGNGGSPIIPLVRKDPRPEAGEVLWNPRTGSIEPESLEGAAAAVHLAGESVAGGRWSARRRERIRASRVDGTRFLARILAGLNPLPRVLVCASAVGIYGDRGDELLHEESAPGTGFLARVCADWEQAADAAREAGIRVVHLRIGLVLSRDGGALATMLPLFRLGLGGRLGSGRQYMSWVSLDDVVEMILFCLDNDELEGPVNAVSPRPVTNREFTRTLGRVLKRPALLPAPTPALRLALGRMADELLLASTRVEPARLLAAGFPFRHVGLEDALRHHLAPRA
jgi:uncharacterized protein (TIGR01777 family)